MWGSRFPQGAFSAHSPNHLDWKPRRRLQPSRGVAHSNRGVNTLHDMTPAQVARFWSKVDMRDSCWSWLGSIDAYGYGIFWVNGRGMKAHRVAYEDRVGAIAAGLVIDHLCRNRSCVNPSHLEPVTPEVNSARGIRSAKTECLRGHRLVNPNLVQSHLARGMRNCRACAAAITAVRKHGGDLQIVSDMKYRIIMQSA